MLAAVTSPPGTPERDEEPHRNQDNFEEDEEEDQVQGDERADHADLKQQQQIPTNARARPGSGT